MNKNFLECEIIKHVLADYFDAVYCADIGKLKKIFHEKASMNGYLGDTMLVGTLEPFFADLSSKPSMAETKTDCRYVVRSIEVTDNIAQAVLFVDNFFGSACILDCFHLIKDKGTWKIICKTFTTV